MIVREFLDLLEEYEVVLLVLRWKPWFIANVDPFDHPKSSPFVERD